MENIVLEMKNVTKRFPGVLALDDASIKLKKGEILGVVGENGAGKSTLMKILSGSYSNKEYEGEVWVEGEEKQFSSVANAKDAGIEMVYQEVNALYEASVAENIYVGNFPGKMFVDYNTLRTESNKIIEKLGISVSANTLAGKLNSGQLQLMSIARSIVNKPKILVLDEPTTALTDSEVNFLMKFLNELREQGVSCIYISHKLDEIFRICDSITVLRDGKTVKTGSVKEFSHDTLVEAMIGRKVEKMYVKSDKDVGEVVLKVSGVTVPHPTIENRNVVNNVSFELRKGEILGVGGLVGAGRSELLGAIFGQIRDGVTKEIYLNGNQITIDSPEDAIKEGFGFVTEERKTTGFVQTMSIKENMSLVSLRDLPNKVLINNAIEREKTKSIFGRLRIKAPSLNTYVVNLSGGNQQKVVLGKWLLKNPKIILIDEPTKGIDVGAKAEFYRVLDELTNNGVSIVMVSSDMPELISISDRVIVLSQGNLSGEFIEEEITETNIMNAAIRDVAI